MDVSPPKCLKKPLVVPHKVLMGPGPSTCAPRVLHALSLPVVGHLNAECTAIMDEIKEGIKYVFQTRNDLTLALSTSGHGGMEAVICNLMQPREKILIAVNGIWGERAANMAMRYGAVVIKMETEAGQHFTLDEFEAEIVKHKPVLLFVIQGESSTGAYQPLEGLGDVCHRHNCLLGVDTVASLGGVPMFADRWGIDAIYSGSQKVLGAPPGLTPISFSQKAQERIFHRRVPIAVFYWDMKILGDYWNCFGRPRVYHHTISSTLLYGLREGLAMIAEEGISNVIKRHQECAKRLYAGLQQIGLSCFIPDEQDRIPTVTTIVVPDHCDWKEVTAYAMKNHMLEISGGLGPTANKVFRIGLMGYNATFDKVDLVLKVFKEALDHEQQTRSCKL